MPPIARHPAKQPGSRWGVHGAAPQAKSERSSKRDPSAPRATPCQPASAPRASPTRTQDAHEHAWLWRRVWQPCEARSPLRPVGFSVDASPTTRRALRQRTRLPVDAPRHTPAFPTPCSRQCTRDLSRSGIACLGVATATATMTSTPAAVATPARRGQKEGPHKGQPNPQKGRSFPLTRRLRSEPQRRQRQCQGQGQRQSQGHRQEQGQGQGQDRGQSQPRPRPPPRPRSPSRPRPLPPPCTPPQIQHQPRPCAPSAPQPHHRSQPHPLPRPGPDQGQGQR